MIGSSLAVSAALIVTLIIYMAADGAQQSLMFVIRLIALAVLTAAV
ncbi:MAG: hypothetical protein PHO15_05460 [Eubacteriales bacterium]|nr:hypothetical protein [Eubacteriales bacterium]